MCGICGVLSLTGPLNLPESATERMIGVLQHRGPDEFGAWRNESLFLGHARLSIIDPESGQQPLSGGDGRCHITYNGEVFNYVELRRELEAHGHVFRSQSDTEVVVHSYLEWGADCVNRFNGQFAFALWDEREQLLLLARDRFGICPLFVTQHEGKLLFASEIKSLKAFPGSRIELDPAAMAEVLTFWVNPAPRTSFHGVSQVPPGHFAIAQPAKSTAGNRLGMPSCLQVTRYWAPNFLPAEQDCRHVSAEECSTMALGLREKLESAVAIRMRADVPVGAYLSGGLDSSVTAALAHPMGEGALQTYGLGFTDHDYDESSWQNRMAEQLEVEHRSVHVDSNDVVKRFRQVPWHAETPMTRAAPGPLMALSNHVHDLDCKVVLTGEGADEVFVGYNIFREAKVRNFWSRAPQSQRRPLLLSRLYPYVEKPPLGFLRSFFGRDLSATADPLYSHRPRWHNTTAAGFLVNEATVGAAPGEAEDRIISLLPNEFGTWGTVAKAQYLEMTLFMSGYLLSTQGDRMLMANSVEGRFPFLDHKLVEYAATIPASAKLQSLREKAILRESVAGLVPDEIVNRSKHPFRAPGNATFKTADGQAIVEEFLLTDSPGWDLWQRPKVEALVAKWRAGRLRSTRDDMSFLAILSGRILQAEFGINFEQKTAEQMLRPDQIVWRE